MASFSSSNPIILIPARMASYRLPGKPLAEIAGKPLILHAWESAIQSQIGPVAVATDSDEIISVIETAGGQAIRTSSQHNSGSDRVFEALQKIDIHSKHDCVLNLQGDLPSLAPQDLQTCLKPLESRFVDIATLGTKISTKADISNPNVVKIIGTPLDESHLRALYFTRAPAPYGNGDYYHHIGIYAYRRDALETFVHLPASILEMREQLEQLRAIEAGLRIDVSLVDSVPLEVNTSEDLDKARQILTALNRR